MYNVVFIIGCVLFCRALFIVLYVLFNMYYVVCVGWCMLFVMFM